MPSSAMCWAACSRFLSGIGEGMQPLVSYCCGAHDSAARKKLLKKGLGLMLATSAVLCLAIVLLRGQLPYVFGASPQTARGSVPSLLCAAVALPFWGRGAPVFVLFLRQRAPEGKPAAYFLATRFASAPCFYTCCPVRFGVNGIWAAFPAAQIVLFAVLCALLGVGTAGQRGLHPFCQGAGSSAKISPIAPVRTSVAFRSAGVGVLLITTSARPS